MAAEHFAQTGRSIFISYRRADAEGEAGRLFDDLVRAYGDESVFMDVAGIQPGVDFRTAIDANVSGCGVLLAVIGPVWATATGSDGTRRLDNPDDFVRLEIATALKRGTPVIPVLVHEAHMPALDLLPEDLKELRYRNSVELTHARWNSDVALLVAALKSYVACVQPHASEPVHATVSVQLPAPQPGPAPVARKSKLPLAVGLGVAAILAIAATVFFFLRSNVPAQSTTVSPAPVLTPAAASTPAPEPASPQQVAPKPSPATQPAGSSPLLGKWRALKNSGQDYPAQLEISSIGGELVVQTMGNCPDKPDGLCLWGDRKATVSGSSATAAKWSPRNTQWEKDHERQVSLVIEPTASGLQVTVHNQWRELNGSARESFVPVQFTKIP